jgi:hypothetical protein
MQEIPDDWDRRQTIIALLGYSPLKDFLTTQLQGARRYDRIENVDWESCSRVLDSASQLEALREGW